MDKSGEKWWKMEGGQGNNDTNWGDIKIGGIRRVIESILKAIDKDKYKTGG